MAPTTASLLLTAAAVAGASAWAGYTIGSRASTSRKPAKRAVPPEGAENEEGSEESSDEESEPEEPLANVKAGLFEPCKLILVVRTDLQMTKGKIAAQCGHATLACYKALMQTNPALVKHWERTGQAKIALKCDSEDELQLLQAQAKSLNLCARSIQDAGRTQVAAGSTTVLGIGPGPVALINSVTSHLKLL